MYKILLAFTLALTATTATSQSIVRELTPSSVNDDRLDTVSVIASKSEKFIPTDDIIAKYYIQERKRQTEEYTENAYANRKITFADVKKRRELANEYFENMAFVILDKSLVNDRYLRYPESEKSETNMSIIVKLGIQSKMSGKDLKFIEYVRFYLVDGIYQIGEIHNPTEQLFY